MGLISWKVVGAMAGLVARRIVPGPDPGRLIVTIIVGMGGPPWGLRHGCNRGIRDWRLVGLTKSACPPAQVHIYNASLRRSYRECHQWRERMLERIVEEESPSLIVTSSLPTYRPREEGKRLDRDASEEAMVEGYTSTLKKLRSTGAPVVLIEDVPHPTKNIPECVSRSLDRLERCATPRSEALDYPKVNTRAAKEVEGVHLIDPRPVA
jgi:hypothetical protein